MRALYFKQAVVARQLCKVACRKAVGGSAVGGSADMVALAVLSFLPSLLYPRAFVVSTAGDATLLGRVLIGPIVDAKEDSERERRIP